MITRGGITTRRAGLVAGAVAAAAVLGAWSSSGRAWGTPSAVSPAELGEHVYRDGLLAGGKPVKATVRGDAVDGRVLACVSCHQRSGLGTVEGRIAAPPINAAALFTPLKERYRGVEIANVPPKRPAYTDDSLAVTLRTGVDPSGRRLDEAMPRFDLPAEEMASLVAYLKTLSATPSLGVSGGTIRLATIVTDDVSPEDREAMLFVLRKYVALKNGQAQGYDADHDNRAARMLAAMANSRELGAKKLELDVWNLHGEPATWRGQLDAYYAKSPVFAILSGISNREWRPVHEFSEQNHLPSLFPITSLPVVSDKAWYTHYLAAGYVEEGEGAARFLAARSPAPQVVIEVVRDSAEGRALADGFARAWNASQQTARLRIVEVRGAAPIAADELKTLASSEPHTAVVVWDGAAALSVVRALGDDASHADAVVVSSSYLGADALHVDDHARARTYFTYPYRLPADETRYEVVAREWLADGEVDARSRKYRIASAAFAATALFSQALMELRGRYYPELLVELVGMANSPPLPSFEHASFGANQRYASKGIYVTQLTQGASPTMVAQSRWLTH